MIRFLHTLRRARDAFISLEYALVTGGLVLVFVAFAVASSGILERSLDATEADLSQPDSLDARVGVVEVPATTAPVLGMAFAAASLPPAISNVPYTFDFGALVSGASGPLSWSNVGNPLPAGFALSPVTGVLAGTYGGTTPETVTLTIAVGDGTASVQQAFVLTLQPEAMVLAPATLPTVVADQPYAFDLTTLAQVPASVLAQDIVWSITGGALPDGLSLDPNTGVVSGTYPGLASGAAVVTVQGVVGAFVDTETYTFTAQGAGLRLNPFGPIAIQAGVPVGLDASLLLEADPALDLGPLVWSIFPVDVGGQPVAWPAGIAASGPNIFGTPTAVQSASYTVRVTATLGALTATRDYSAPYTGAGVDLVAASPSIPSPRANVTYSHDLGQWLARDTTAPAPTWSITAGTLPAGLSLNATTGVVSGMYTALEDDMREVTVRVALPDGRADEQAYTFAAIGSGAVATSQVLPTARYGVPYSFDLRNTLTTRQPFDLATLTWTVSGSPLPSGLSINTATGIISGTHFASQDANLSILVVATDGNNVTATAVHTLPIDGSAPFQLTGSVENACALDEEGGIWCWGSYGTRPALGNLTHTNTVTRPARVTETNAGRGFVQISMGSPNAVACAVKNTGALWCWGQHAANGKAGASVGNFSNVDEPAPVIQTSMGLVKQVSVGGDQTCAVTQAHRAWCWGLDGAGALGETSGTTNTRYAPVQVSTATGMTEDLASVSAGRNHTCALTMTGVIWCWGNNTNGELGRGTTTNTGHDVPQPVSAANGFVNSGVRAVSAGTNFTCALDSAGKAWCWGAFANGRLGGNYAAAQPLPQPVTDTLIGTNLTDISAGPNFACTLKGSTGQIWCWGNSLYGRLGNGVTSDGNYLTPQAVGAAPGGGTYTSLMRGSGMQHMCAWNLARNSWCWGDNFRGQVGIGSQGTIPRNQGNPVLTQFPAIN